MHQKLKTTTSTDAPRPQQSEPLPCPFCFTVLPDFYEDENADNACWFECHNCGARGPIAFNTKKEALGEWNFRPPSSCIQKYIPSDLVENLQQKFFTIAESTGEEATMSFALSGCQIIDNYRQFQHFECIHLFEKFINRTKTTIVEILKNQQAPDPGNLILALCESADELGCDWVAGTKESTFQNATEIAALAFMILKEFEHKTEVESAP